MLNFPFRDIDSERIILGRGNMTNIEDPVISRRICSIEFLDQTLVSSTSKKRKHENTGCEVLPILRMLKAPGTHKVTVNDIKVSVENGDYVFLNDGDTLSLHSTRHYGYSVMVKRRNRHHFSDPPSAPCPDIARKAASNLCDEIKCPICMEIYVESHASNPCGHLFCGTCVRDWIGDFDPKERLNQPIECPSCRMPINSFTLVRQYDSMIWNLLLCRTFPQEDLRDDVLVFLRRCGKDVSSLSPAERECLFGSKYDPKA